MNKRVSFYFSFALVILILLVGVLGIKASTAYADTLQNAQAYKAQLEAELASLEQDIAKTQAEQKAQKGTSASLSRDINSLKSQINKVKREIQNQNSIIQKLGGKINQKSNQIELYTNKMNNEVESLAQLIRKQRELEATPLINLLLSSNTVSEAYSDLANFDSIKANIKLSLEQIKSSKDLTQEEKIKLQDQQNQIINVKNKLESTKATVVSTEKAKQKALSQTQSKISALNKSLAEKAQRRTEILSALFKLRDASAIPFGEALKYANLAFAKTGVSPAFLLAILTQETNLGANQGSCYVTNFKTGDGVVAKTGKAVNKVMKPMGLSGRKGDTSDFLSITSELGRNPYKTLVSCPIGSYGYGGAMGPAQFIPTTWQGIKDRVASILGIKTPDPWNPENAFMASALFLKDLGGSSSRTSTLRNAACKYYSGRSCSDPHVKNAFYGNAVISKMQNIQTTMIDPLQN